MNLWSREDEVKASILEEFAEEDRARAAAIAAAAGAAHGGGRKEDGGPGWTWLTNLLIAAVGALVAYQVSALRADVKESLDQSKANGLAIAQLQTEMQLRVENAKSEHAQFNVALEKIVGRLEVLERRNP